MQLSMGLHCAQILERPWATYQAGLIITSLVWLMRFKNNMSKVTQVAMFLEVTSQCPFLRFSLYILFLHVITNVHTNST